ncbi:hypothetical protein MML48_5g00014585 [Holotrichia oblita]|uniref:Uncharacterized protein n=1 Tax=Holotrichia oblita TaxID=644536 RepID=A0ACB9T160_HOLOL|nr:hypothetical protein MML48_5g00014585 [Holotrichia oblita]
MASIEVSLSSTPRRKKNGSINGSITSSIRSIPKEIAVKELESLRNALRDKENIIQSLKGQLTIPSFRLSHIRTNGICNNNNSTNNNRELSDVEKKQAEERLCRLRNDTDNKRLAIKNLKMALERLDITDNIDVRIQQAELEYQLGREELNLLTLLEETRALQLCLEESNKSTSDTQTFYSCVTGNDLVSLHAVEIVYDPKSPRFGAGQKDSNPGLWIDWALDDTGICKGDRLIEVNGKIVLTKTREDLARLLSAAPDPAQIVVLRKNCINNGNAKNCSLQPSSAASSTNTAVREVASLRSELEVVRERAEEAQRAKDGLRSDNIRLTHRISYLEEQVAELLGRKNSESDIRIVTQSPVITSTVKSNQNITNINITSQQTSVVPTNDLQVFQKGPQVTALVANLPGLEVSKDTHSALPVRSKSSLSNVSNTHIPAPSPQPSEKHSCQKGHRHKHRSANRNSLQLGGGAQVLDHHNYKKHYYHVDKEREYNSEMGSSSEQRSINKRVENGFNKSHKELVDNSSLMEQSYKKATKIVHDLTKQTNLYEKHRQKCISASEKYNGELLKHYNSRKSTSVMDFRSEVHIGPKYDSRSIETLDNIETNLHNKRLYKKNDVRSVKSLDFDSDCNSNTNYKNNCQKNIDYTSEPIETNKKLNQYHHHDKPRPTPPKKPIRLSLHRAQSVQPLENGPGDKDNRKPLKRNYKGEIPPSMTFVSLNGEKTCELMNGKLNGAHRGSEELLNGNVEIKWNGVHHQDMRLLENGSWC